MGVCRAFVDRKARRDLSTLVERQYREAEKAREQFQALEASRALADENLRARTRAFEEGLSPSLEVVDLGKRFDIYPNDRSRFFEFFGTRTHHVEHWALRGLGGDPKAIARHFDGSPRAPAASSRGPDEGDRPPRAAAGRGWPRPGVG